MAFTFELYDGSTTLDLKDGTNYDLQSVSFQGADKRQETFAGNELRRIKFLPHRLECTVKIIGSSLANLLVNERALTTMLRKAEGRQIEDAGTTKIILNYQLGNTDSADIAQRVISGSLIMPSGRPQGVFIQPNIDQNEIYEARLSLLLEPLGRLADVSPTPETVENEQDSTNLNYMDITTITGSTGARMELKVHDANNGGGTPWTGDKKMWIAKRSGERRTDTLFIQAADSFTKIQDVTTVAWYLPAVTFNSGATGGLTTNASGATSSYVEMDNDTGSGKTEVNNSGTEFSRIAYAQYDISTLPKGRFRLLARVSAFNNANAWGPVGALSSNFGIAAEQVFGGTLLNTPVDAATIAGVSDNALAWPTDTNDEWNTVDLGEVLIPPIGVPSGSGTDPTLNIRIYWIVYLNGSGSMANGTRAAISIDYIFLLPVDEGVVVVDSVGTDDRVLISNKEDVPGVWLLNTSDVVQSFATFNGGPFNIGPEDTRIYWLRDDVGDPTTNQAVLTPIYTPLMQGI